MSELIKQWEEDAPVDTTNASGEIARIPLLHSKYNKYLSLHKLSCIRKMQKLDVLRKDKWLWINGKLSQEQLTEMGWEPFQLTILKPDQQMWLDADEDIQKLKGGIAFSEECVSFCTYVMKELNNRSYELRAFMDWEKFTSGGN